MKTTIKQIITLNLIIVCTIVQSGCTLLQRKIATETKDINGEKDTSLAVFTDGDVCAKEPECYCMVYGFEPKGEKSYTDKDYFHDSDITEASAVTPLSGIATLQQTYGKTDTIKFTVDSKLAEGNLRIVLLDLNYKILYDFTTNESSSVEINEATGKEFEIRAVGESAKFEITTTREFC